MARTFQPLGDRIVIKPNEEEEVSKGGLLLPDTARERPQEGEVIAAGPGRVSDTGQLIPMSLGVGDKVLFPQFGATRINEDDDELLFFRESDILAKIS
ncbi:MAG: co-chaperone GroES [Chloroflexi bacterium]|nr:co-chaperone GroES [Chloroflexota bacterium]